MDMLVYQAGQVVIYDIMEASKISRNQLRRCLHRIAGSWHTSMIQYPLVYIQKAI